MRGDRRQALPAMPIVVSELIALILETILKQVEQLHATAGTLPVEVEVAVEKLLNVVESLCSHNQTLLDEVKRLRQEQKKKKKPKTTSQQNQDGNKKID